MNNEFKPCIDRYVQSNDLTDSKASTLKTTQFFCWAAVLTIAFHVLLQFDLLFSQPQFEFGDFAANSFAIDDAAKLERVLGNYSRFGFSHPGPAFFYIYAGGEKLFYDWLKWCPAEHNAHILTGIILQSLFWAVSVTAIRARMTNSHSAILIAMILLAYFQLTGYAFTSIWPPHQLLMPFFCMLVTATCILAGDRNWLWAFVLSCCFCVHGHVAQPLFVVPLTIMVVSSIFYDLLQRSRKHDVSLRRSLVTSVSTKQIAFSIAAIAVSILPLVIDLQSERFSNTAKIIEHAIVNRKLDHTMLDSFIYYLNFYSFWGSQEVPDLKLGLAFLQTHGWICAAWSAGLAGTAFAFWQSRGHHASVRHCAVSRWTKMVLFLSLVCHILTIRWGMMMDGEMFAFNGFFNYAIIALNMVICLTVISGWIGDRLSAPVCVFVGATIIAIVSVSLEPPAEIDKHPSDLHPIPKCIPPREITNESIVYFRSFNNMGSWAWMAGQANAWRKQGFRIAVPRDLTLILGERRSIESQLCDATGAIHCVDFMGHRNTDNGVFALLKCTDQLTREDCEYRWSMQELARHQSGFVMESDTNLTDSVVTVGRVSTLVIPAIGQLPELELQLEAESFLSQPSQFELSLGGTKIYSGKVAGRETFIIPLSQSLVSRVIKQRTALVFSMSPPDADAAFFRLPPQPTTNLRIYSVELQRPE
ncbi:hypothetical protein [Neorhodopirellula pilleata]|uniref:Glycosyltransferase RgtA/B/C/D-like domain-containing protein n=1 Tax=Neorhodopirellula pilleata TaxID=2714738 RepID=A0A5C6APB1_9BACT|nr:hypothetical protein [Neorhodopirellula pilleata]TWU01347.1 hypothetical protein Pla100_10740 [Neorhodopirellula pilleata]